MTCLLVCVHQENYQHTPDLDWFSDNHAYGGSADDWTARLYCAGVEKQILELYGTIALHIDHICCAGFHMVPELLESVGVPILKGNTAKMRIGAIIIGLAQWKL